ncbi:MAG: hypothetical protein IK999_08005 [Ruminococcus sp.]|nr:hypothetical protein [Ruminococcus sp.]
MKTLAKSKHLCIWHEYEAAFVLDTTDGTTLASHEFYGDPYGALIDRDERFAVIYGCEVFVYDLSRKTSYVFGDGKVWFIDAVQNEDASVTLNTEDGKRYIIEINDKTVICKEK